MYIHKYVPRTSTARITHVSMWSESHTQVNDLCLDRSDGMKNVKVHSHAHGETNTHIHRHTHTVCRCSLAHACKSACTHKHTLTHTHTQTQEEKEEKKEEKKEKEEEKKAEEKAEEKDKGAKSKAPVQSLTSVKSGHEKVHACQLTSDNVNMPTA
jgi:hypothetical protein